MGKPERPEQPWKDKQRTARSALGTKAGKVQKQHHTQSHSDQKPWQSRSRGPSTQPHTTKPRAYAGRQPQAAGKGAHPKQQDTEGDEDYMKALRRMEMGPMDSDGDLSDFSEDSQDGRMAAAGPGPSSQRLQAQQQQQQLAGRHALPTQRRETPHDTAFDGAVDDEDADDEGDEEEEGEGEEEELQGGSRRQASMAHGSKRAAGPRVAAHAHGDEDDADGDPDEDEDEDDDEEAEEEDDEGEDEEDTTDAGEEDTMTEQQRVQAELEQLPFEARLVAQGNGQGPSKEMAQAAARAAKIKEAERVFKRANRHRPAEMSSKKPVSRAREVLPPMRKVGRDPRFEPASLREKDAAARRYAFVYDEVMAGEKSKLRDAVKAQKDPYAKAAASVQLQRLESKLQQERARRQRSDLDTKVKTSQKQAAGAGKTPFFLKNSDKRKLELVAKFETLKSQGKLDRFMEKRRKHNASKDHRYLPGARGAGDGMD